MMRNRIIFSIGIILLLSSCDVDEPETQNNNISRNNPGKIEDLKPADISIARRICTSYISKKEKMELLGDGELSLSYKIYDFACSDIGFNYKGELSANLRVPLRDSVYFETRSNLRFIGEIETDENGMMALDDYCTKVLRDTTKTHVEIDDKLIRFRFMNQAGKDIVETGTYIKSGDGHIVQRIDSFTVDTNINSLRYGLVLERAQARFCDENRKTGFKQVLK